MFPNLTAAPRQPFDWQVSTLSADDDHEEGGNNNNNWACCCPGGAAAFCSARLLAPLGTTPFHALCPVSCAAQDPTRWLMETPSRRTAGRAAYPAFSPGCKVLKPAFCSSGSRTPSGEAFRLCAQLHALPFTPPPPPFIFSISHKVIMSSWFDLISLSFHMYYRRQVDLCSENMHFRTGIQKKKKNF